MRIVDFYKQNYKEYVILFLKLKAWENRRLFLERANIHIHQISADHRTKEDGSKEELIILQDNLDD